MAFFKLRKGGDEAAGSRQPESIEAIRRRARHRLIGAGVLVLIGVLGFPILFDTQPRPIAVDVPIEIPDRNKVAPLPEAAAPAPAVATAPSAPAASAPPAVAAVVPAKPAPAPEARPTVTAKAPELKPEPKPEPKAPAKGADDGARAAALLEGKAAAAGASTAPAAAEGRFVVQVGAFADVAKAREVRQKLEKAGLKTYTNVAETKDGKRIRVRLGPFTSRADAEKAAEKARRLDLTAALLTL
ncbi:SPOR domain-containing protein [Ramlibacter aquaticus]|uniref:SPOR domain-containing protein n=1 Tax=Ramlibacter aquaticus TaxID=2780094 RepID=A0ABR9SHK5_9BURK|nr:SPOR domain-containing protein [Ramlibacter aquaticus]MBE7941359.1 SPOR domain-containing protein [Ramlibacter aquaticus]